jgi:hypothetical protein
MYVVNWGRLLRMSPHFLVGATGGPGHFEFLIKMRSEARPPGDARPAPAQLIGISQMIQVTSDCAGYQHISRGDATTLHHICGPRRLGTSLILGRPHSPLSPPQLRHGAKKKSLFRPVQSGGPAQSPSMTCHFTTVPTTAC